MANNIRIICVGKLKAEHWRGAQDHYLKRLKPYAEIELTQLKDGPGALPPEERTRVEGEAILAALRPQDHALCLDRRGKAQDSPGLADKLRLLLEDANRRPCFVVGGAYDIWRPVRDQAQGLISLGPMTLPHELARVVLLEQLYRAMTILRGLPYHH